MTAVIAILAFMLAIGILVTIHEYGHFIVARSLGIKVLRFSVGFGRPLLKINRGRDRTEYVIAMVPLGGYVKMLDERETAVAPEELSRAFNRQPVWKKSLVVLAGPFFNFLFAWLAYWLTFVIGIPSMSPIIGPVAPGSFADQAGLRNGDEIVSIEGNPTPTWQATALALLDGVVRGATFEVIAEDETGVQRQLQLELPQDKALTEPGSLLVGLGLSRWQPPAILGEIDSKGAARSAGLLDGDRITSVDGEPITGLSDWLSQVRASPGNTLILGIIRDGAAISLPVTPASVEDDGVLIGRVGVRMHIDEEVRNRLFAVQRFGVIDAAGEAVKRTWGMSVLTLKLLGRMVTGDVSLKNISGPINIAQYAGITASFGFVYYIAFLAIISVSLGVLNLLPIPVLDGGHLLYFVVEAVKGSPVSSHVEMAGQRVGLLLLVLLMTVAFYNDIVRLFD